ncbi:E3 SUMO-protein ligase PIAS1-like isoform X2 [Cyclopterus lumpus]|uniref:E3 SUMO-protein ligase PIAS1-like isoform X2 n=1 Tax=Cyclopterus lumpus TaxID=8103 RepID=UPI0014869796|nr:E3 SUMO-protein ligase PIAS1-like isoform X2 [Cyclopterus lumpus]
MVMSLRVSELQVLLGYAGRNKHGRKHELLSKALHLLKAGSSPAVSMKVKELYRRRFPAKMVSHSELAMPGPHHPATAGVVGGGGAALPAGLTQLAYEGHGGAPSPAALLPLSLLGPGKHELTGLTHHLSGSATLHPVHPDVKLQRLPFYDMLDELIKPTSLASDNSQRFQETCFAFALTPQQVQQISSSMDISGTKCDFSVQVQLRFCLSETSCPQEDHFPPNLCVKVNGKPCNLPGYLPPTKNGVEPKRPSRPINITSLVRLSTTVPNTIVVSWTAEIGRSYSMAVYLVKQQSSTVLLQRLRAKGIRNPDHSRALIKEKLTADPDSEIATTSLRVSLLCPLGKMRLMIPCRALTCSHLQCFDATLYIQMNEKKPTWVCPVCDKKAPFEHLIIDGLFVEILNSCMDCDEIQFKEDGSWAPMRSKREVQEVSSASYNGLDGETCYEGCTPTGFMSDVRRLGPAELLVLQPRGQRQQQRQESGGDRLDTGQLLGRRRTGLAAASAAAPAASSPPTGVSLHVADLAARHQQRSVEPAPPGLPCEPHAQHARRGHQLHPSHPPTHPGLPTLLPHPQRPVGVELLLFPSR